MSAVDSLMFHACLVAGVMCFGYILRIPFVGVESLFPAGTFLARSSLLSLLPLFLFCLISGLALQRLVDLTGVTAARRKPTQICLEPTRTPPEHHPNPHLTQPEPTESPPNPHLTPPNPT